jgi:hypothetical protein
VEKIMSTTNDTSGELTRNELDAVLQDDELDAASGGLYVNPITGILFGVVLPAVNPCSNLNQLDPTWLDGERS